MSRPQPMPACEHVRDGTRAHHSRGLCTACYHRAQYQPRRQAHPPRLPRGRLPADFDTRLLLALWGGACPIKYCGQCGRRIGPTCPVCEPARVSLDGPDARAAAWVRGAG